MEVIMELTGQHFDPDTVWQLQSSRSIDWSHLAHTWDVHLSRMESRMIQCSEETEHWDPQVAFVVVGHSTRFGLQFGCCSQSFQGTFVGRSCGYNQSAAHRAIHLRSNQGVQ
jgi:hypothetical protein